MFKHLRNYPLVYSFLWRTFGKSWRVRFAYIIRIINTICKTVVLPIATATLIAGLATGDYDGIWRSVWIYIGTSFTIGIFHPSIKWVGTAGESIKYAEVTGMFFKKLITTDIEYFNSNMSGYLTTMTRKFCDSCVLLVRRLRNQFIPVLIQLIFPLVIIMCCDLFLGVVAFVIAMTQAIYLIWSSKRVEYHRATARKFFRINSGKISDAVSNVLAIRSAGQEETYIDNIEHDAKAEADVFVKRFKVESVLIIGREVICVVFFAIMLWLVVWRAQSGYIDLTVAVLVVNYMIAIMVAADNLSDCLSDHDDLIDEIVPGFAVLDRINKIQDPEKPEKLGKVRGDIELQNVSFSYAKQRGKAEVFRKLSLKIPHGQKVGVVGLSGAGKSTLTKLILRFNDVDDGSIMVDGHDIRNIRSNDLHRMIAYVPQEPLLFHASIRENVVVAKPRATKKEIEDALRAAHAWDFVRELPDKLDSIVGERGVKLSGGQKQRVAIARAFIQHAPVMILDEATSALDSESEQIIKDSFKEILRGKTAIVVAHRLSTLSEMDRIVVIDNGKLVEDGTHDELLAMDKLYAKLWRRQLKNTE